MNGVTTPPLS